MANVHRRERPARDLGISLLEPLAAEPRAHGIALAIVAVTTVAALIVAPPDAASTFLLFAGAVGVSAYVGGLAPGVTATLASILVLDVVFRRTPAVVVGPWTTFAIVALLFTWLLTRSAERLAAVSAELEETRGQLRDAQAAAARSDLLNRAFDRLSAVSEDSAAIVLNAQGVITEWPSGAKRVYGGTTSEMLGVSAQALFGVALQTSALEQLLAEASRAGRARWSGVQRRHDGTSFDADVEVRPAGGDHAGAFTFVVRDLTRERVWEAFRGATARSETALRQDTALMKQQLEALESVTDPMLDPLNRDDVEELLERLRVAVDADGVAFVAPVGVRKRLITANGLQPVSTNTIGTTDLKRATNRVLLVQNDPARVAQQSVCLWPDTASCLIAVPIASGGQVRSVIEVVNERPRRSTDADMALIRVVANRVAAFGRAEFEEKGAVA